MKMLHVPMQFHHPAPSYSNKFWSINNMGYQLLSLRKNQVICVPPSMLPFLQTHPTILDHYIFS